MKIKKLKLPLSEMTGNEKNYTAVLLEDVNSNMRAFWDLLQDVKKRGGATFEQVGRITERTDSMEIKIDGLMSMVSLIKVEIEALKTSLSAKADKEKLEILEHKIIRIEKYLKLVH